MRSAEIIAALERLAPPSLAEPWDNVGLILGDPAREPAGERAAAVCLLTIDLTEAVVDEAVAAGAGLIICYHPPIFAPIKRLTGHSGLSRALLRAARAGLCIYSPHTALDACPGGIADWLLDSALPPLARTTPAPDRTALTPHALSDPRQTHKVVVFVPAEIADRVRDAMAAAGAGRIGLYDTCSFRTPGVGSFRGLEGSNPTVGRAGRVESADELRLEMVCGERDLAAVILAARRAHTYEEPAIDVYSLSPPPDARTGPGRAMTLPAPTGLGDVAAALRAGLGNPAVQLAAPAGREQAPITRIGVCPGSGGSLAAAARRAGCDLFITGEMKHHEVLAALDSGLALILAGHTETERPYLPVLAQRLAAADSRIRALVSTADRPPLRTL
ncbi:MAG: Nif3-like dinuclear metal center hexameric protein [Phycisphaerales bacterium]|nr:Nif3-like dinuclear metal center hexameric protein [Phycisphaerales bacterium]